MANKPALASHICPACRGDKLAWQGFCTKCYYSLPEGMRAALYCADGDFPVRAFAAAFAFLTGKPPAATQPDQPARSPSTLFPHAGDAPWTL